MSKPKRCLNLLVALLALGAAIAIVWRAGLPARSDFARLPGGGAGVAAPEVGSLAPRFALPSVDAGNLYLAPARGTITIINFWATWCQPCRREMGELQDLYAAYPGRLRIFALNQAQSVQVARDWVNELGLTYDILLDESGSVARLYQIRGLPTTFVLDEDRVIRRVYFGAVSQARLRQDLASLERRL